MCAPCFGDTAIASPFRDLPDFGGTQEGGKQAHWKHGRFSAEARQELVHFRQLLRECKEVEEMMNR